MLALGSILEGPDEKEIHNAAERHLENMVRAALPILTRLMADPVVQVKDTTAWTIGRICEYLPEVGVCPPCCLCLSCVCFSCPAMRCLCGFLRLLRIFCLSLMRLVCFKSDEDSPFFSGERPSCIVGLGGGARQRAGGPAARGVKRVLGFARAGRGCIRAGCKQL